MHAQTLPELHAALDASPVGSTAKTRADAARTAAHADAALPNPSIGAEAVVVPGVERELQLSVAQAFPLARRSAAQRSLGEAQRDAELAAGALALHTRHADLADAYYTAAAAQQRLGVLRARAAAIERAANALQRRVEAGDAAPFEHARMQAELRRAHRAIALAESGLSRALRDVGAHAYTEAPTHVDATLLPPDCTPPTATPPQLLALQADRAVAAARADVVRTARAPHLELGAGWVTIDDDAWRHGFAASVAVELPLWARTARAVDAATAEATALDAEYAVEQRRAQLEVASHAQRCAELRAQATDAAASVEQAQALLHSVEAGYHAGELGLLELLDAQRAVMDEQLDAIDLQHEARRAHNDIRRITGGWR